MMELYESAMAAMICQGNSDIPPIIPLPLIGRTLHLCLPNQNNNSNTTTDYEYNYNHTVDGRNPAPPGMYKTL